MSSIAHEPVPRWLQDMSGPIGVPVICAEGEHEGAVTFMPEEAVAAAVAAGTHISLVGRDMTTFDFATEKAKRPQPAPMGDARNRDGSETAADGDPTSTEPEEKPVAKPAAGKGNTRVGRYANRALVTKPGAGD